VSELDGASVVMMNWQLSFAATTIWLCTLARAFAHCNVALAGALVASDQVPGPTRGTSATLKDGVSCPDRSPLATLSPEATATGVTLEPVLFEETVAA
jgi:hypothetical protein